MCLFLIKLTISKKSTLEIFCKYKVKAKNKKTIKILKKNNSVNKIVFVITTKNFTFEDIANYMKLRLYLVN